jgi:hypothetical protein
MNIGFVGLIQLLFIGLKITDNIDWSWIVVFTPLLFSLTVGLIVFTMFIYYANSGNKK